MSYNIRHVCYQESTQDKRPVIDMIMSCKNLDVMETRIFVLHSHKENGEDAHVWHLRKDNGDTHDIYVTFAQRKVGQFHSKKEAKRFCSSHNIRVMYEIIRNKAVFILNKWRYIVWQSHKIKRDNSNGKLKDICGSPQRRIQLSYLGGRGGEN